MLISLRSVTVVILGLMMLLAFQNCGQSNEGQSASSSQYRENSSLENNRVPLPDNPLGGRLPGGSQGGNPGEGQDTSNPPGTPSVCSLKSSRDLVFLGVHDLAFDWTSSLRGGHVAQRLVVSQDGASGSLSHEIQSLGAAPGRLVFNPTHASAALTPFLLNYSKMTLYIDTYEGVNCVQWSSCAGQRQLVVRVERESIENGNSCEIPEGVESTSCGGVGVRVFSGGVCEILETSVAPEFKNKFFQCVKENGEFRWDEVSLD
jgi:hypothetical protein